MKKTIFFIIIGIFLLGCKTYSESDKSDFDRTIEKYLDNSTVEYKRSPSGLYYHIEKEGQGDFIKVTDIVSFTYEGRLLNGKIFDDAYKRKPLEFDVRKLIQGWQEAMLYLKKGGKVKLIVPPQLGYGDYELDRIPKHSILCFDLEVKDVH